MQETHIDALPAAKFIAFAIYTFAVVIGLACSALTIYILLVMSLVFGLSFLVLTVVPAVLDMLFLVLIIMLLRYRKWRRYMYKAQVWLPVLLSLPLICWLNYSYAMVWRGF